MKKRSELKLILCCISLAMVAGCGGGGGYGGGVASSSNYVSTFLRTPNVSGTASADARRVTRTTSGDQELAMSDASTATDSIRITFGSNSALSDVTFSNNVGSASFNSSQLSSTTIGSRIRTIGTGSNISANINSYSNYMDYGHWEYKSGNTIYQSWFVSGAETSSSSIPTSGTATYLGHSLGIASKPLAGQDENTFLIDSSVTINADYGTKFVNLQIDANSVNNVSNNASVATDISVTGRNAYAITGSGTISSGNSMSGGLTLTNSGQQGVFSGKFYGPSAENIGGTFTFSGTSLKYTGSFGAAK